MENKSAVELALVTFVENADKALLERIRSGNYQGPDPMPVFGSILLRTTENSKNEFPKPYHQTN